MYHMQHAVNLPAPVGIAWSLAYAVNTSTSDKRLLFKGLEKEYV